MLDSSSDAVLVSQLEGTEENLAQVSHHLQGSGRCDRCTFKIVVGEQLKMDNDGSGRSKIKWVVSEQRRWLKVKNKGSGNCFTMVVVIRCIYFITEAKYF